MRTPLLLAALAAASLAPPAEASGKATLARETAEYALQKFGVAAARDGVEGLAQRILVATTRHGDDVVAAVRRVGPRALALGDDAGAHAPQAYRLMARHGDDAAVWVLARPKAAGLAARYGDDAAEAMVRHKGVAEPLIEVAGAPAIKALTSVRPQNGRRLAMMAEGGELAVIGRTPDLLGVIARYGDRAMDFVWRNKGALAVATTLTVFLANPEPFLDGTARLGEAAAEHVAKPVVQETARTASTLVWALLVLLVVVVAGVCVIAVRHPRLATAIFRIVARRRA